MSDREERAAAAAEARELKRQRDEARRRRALKMLRDGVPAVEIQRALRMSSQLVMRLAREAPCDT